MFKSPFSTGNFKNLRIIASDGTAALTYLSGSRAFHSIFIELATSHPTSSISPTQPGPSQLSFSQNSKSNYFSGLFLKNVTTSLYKNATMVVRSCITLYFLNTDPSSFLGAGHFVEPDCNICSSHRLWIKSTLIPLRVMIQGLI